MKTAWDFVEEWYPNYYSCSRIATADDLQKLLDEEYEKGDAAHSLLNTMFSGCIKSSYGAIQAYYDAIHKEIYEVAIGAYLASKCVDNKAWIDNNDNKEYTEEEMIAKLRASGDEPYNDASDEFLLDEAYTHHWITPIEQ